MCVECLRILSCRAAIRTPNAASKGASVRGYARFGKSRAAGTGKALYENTVFLPVKRKFASPELLDSVKRIVRGDKQGYI
jgi:hypothetical protein